MSRQYDGLLRMLYHNDLLGNFNTVIGLKFEFSQKELLITSNVQTGRIMQ